MTTYLLIILVFLIGLFCANFARIVLKTRTMLWFFILLEKKKLTRTIDQLSKKYEKQLTWLLI